MTRSPERSQLFKQLPAGNQQKYHEDEGQEHVHDA